MLGYDYDPKTRNVSLSKDLGPWTSTFQHPLHFVFYLRIAVRVALNRSITHSLLEHRASFHFKHGRNANEWYISQAISALRSGL